MENHQIIQMRKPILSLIKGAKVRLDSASLVLEGEASVDVIPILFKAMDLAVRSLLAFKQKPLSDFLKNIHSLEEEYQKDVFFINKETMEILHSLYEMNEKYKSETELESDERAIKNIFEKAENFLAKTEKFLKTQLTTQKERAMKKRRKKVIITSIISLACLIIIFFLVKLGINKFGPQHGLLAHYYNNINLAGPPEVEKIDKKIDFVWGNNSPQKNIVGEFSVRWEGRIKIDKSDDYTFYILSDEGVRLFLDDKIIIDIWSDEKRTMEHSGHTQLEKGFHKIRVEYYFNQRHADLKLLWSSQTFKKRVVGNKVLYPPLAQNASR